MCLRVSDGAGQTAESFSLAELFSSFRLPGLPLCKESTIGTLYTLGTTERDPQSYDSQRIVRNKCQ